MMWTVPTLCATGSIVGAAGVGYAFGQAHSQPTFDTHEHPTRGTTPSNNCFETGSQLPLHQVSNSHQDVESALPVRNTTPPSSQRSRVLHTSSRAVDKSGAGFEDLGEISKPLSRVHQSERENSNFVQRQPSRLQRFASFTFSVKSTPTVSSGLESRSLAQSSGSAAPFIALERLHSSPLPPNKLVKRSLSQHQTQRPRTSDDDRKWQTLDRPATKHKRLATLCRRPWAEDENSTTFRHSTKLPRTYQSFFRPKIPKDRASATFRNKSGLGDSSHIRRVYPNSSDHPTLLPSCSVLPFSVEVDGSLPITSEPFVFGSRPGTSSGIIQFFSSPGPPSASQAESAISGPEPRQSFSISDLLTRNHTVGKRPRKLLLSKGRRVTSASAISMHDGQSPRAADKSHKHRDVGASKTRSASGSQQASTNIPEHKESASNYVAADVQHRRDNEKTAQRSGTLPPTPLSKGDSPASNVSASPMSRTWRNSATPSENTSSQIGSDFEPKVFSSADEDEGDKQSDSVYDSLRTGANRSNSGFRGPPLETLFDKEPAYESATNTPSANNVETPFPVQSNSRSNLETEGSNSTPARTVIPDGRESQWSSENKDPRSPPFASSPPPQPESLSLGELGFDSDLGDDEYSLSEDDLDYHDESWEEDRDEEHDGDDESQNQSSSRTAEQSALTPFGPQRSAAAQEQKNNLFDWSEQPPLQRGLDGSPLPRPKTVHGKKNPGGRGSRSAGRRAPTGLHARSQSVPVLADLAASRTPITSKFGTWGIGSKGVTEDWNEDFDFDVPAPTVPREDSHGTVYLDRAMVVPDAIKARQTKVLANIGLLKEWGLGIEKLKELREKTIALNFQADRYPIFNEVDAMIDLADQEADDDGLTTYPAPTQALAADFEGAEVTSSSPAAIHPTRLDDQHDDVSRPPPMDSVLRSSPPARALDNYDSTPTTRPRKNSEAVAQSVIMAIQQRGKARRRSTSPRTPARSKVPFDTTTLRHIVPYVSGLANQMKQIIREAETLQSSPTGSDPYPETLLQQAFIEPVQQESPANLRHRLNADDSDDESLISQMASTKINE